MGPQAISDSKSHIQEFMIATIQDYLSIMDACIDPYEVRVQQSLSEAQPSNLTTL